jgi:uncharacterized protein (TIGR02594 family)
MTGKMLNTYDSYQGYFNIAVFDNATLYAGKLMTVDRNNYTKHYFAETERIASALGGGRHGALISPDTKLRLIKGDTPEDLYKEYEYNAIIYYYSKHPHEIYNKSNYAGEFKGKMLLGAAAKLPDLYNVFNKKTRDGLSDITYWFTANHIGSGSMITNSAGAVKHTLHYTAFGETLLDNAINYQTPYQFAGYERDGESGLNYAGARYYRKDIFISTDPMWAKYPSLTSYNYCGNNPIMITDPTGMDWVENNETKDITWNKNVTSADNTPDGFTYRGTSYQREKIWTNQIVKGNSESGLMQESYNSNGNMAYNNLTPWIDAAFEELGTARFEGAASNPRIEEYLTYTQLTGTAINDATSWCAGFANFALETSGVDGTGSAMALSFRNWGESLDAPAYGSVATISYGGGKGHVGFVIGINSKEQILILGGNQGSTIRSGQNEVNISPNSVSSFKYNYPAGLSPYYKLPTLNITGKSISYGNTR